MEVLIASTSWIGRKAEKRYRFVGPTSKSLEHDPTIGGAINWQGLSDANYVAALLKN